LLPASTEIARRLAENPVSAALIAFGLLISSLVLRGPEIVLHSSVRGFGEPLAVLGASLLTLGLLLPSHELGHAVAALFLGTPLLSVQIRLNRFFVPVGEATTSFSSVDQRRKRVLVPIAGPLVHLLCASAAAWILTWTPAHSVLGNVLALFFLVAMLTFLAGINPFLAGDGSQALEAALGARGLRRKALGLDPAPDSNARKTWAYRFACACYLLFTSFVVRAILSVTFHVDP